jgi:hypothetical protein
VTSLQYLRITSIAAGLLVGFWLPIHLVGYALPAALDIAFDLLVSVASGINIYLAFKENGWKPTDWRRWASIGILADLLCLMPVGLIGHVALPATGKSFLFLNFLTVRHVRRIKKFLDGFPDLQPIAYRLVPLAIVMPLLVHLVACGWIALGSGTAGPDPDAALEYVKAIYWSFTTLTTVGYGDISAKTPFQMLFACGIQVIGVGVFGFILSNVASLLSRMDAAREHHMDSLDKVETFMRSHEIPRELRSKIRTYYNYLWANHRGYRDNTLLQDLPEKMQSELFMFINRTIVEKVPMLSGASRELIEDLMNELKPRIYVPGERVFRVDETGDAMYFIHSGKVQILSRENKLIAELPEGAYFGEMALLSSKPRSATARATEFCDIYVLSRSSFERVVSAYPEFGAHLEQTMRERQELRRAG